MPGLLEFGGEKKLKNMFTGVKPTSAGKKASGLLGGGMIAKEYAKGKLKPRVMQETPGIHQAEQMTYDYNMAPGMGASGDLTLALSEYGMGGPK